MPRPEIAPETRLSWQPKPLPSPASPSRPHPMRFFPIRPTPRPRRLSAVRHVHYLNATPQAGPSRSTSLPTHTTQIFARQIANTDRLTLVDFYAEYVSPQSQIGPRLIQIASWCGPCRALTPILKKLTSDSETLDLITIDTDQHFELAARYKVPPAPSPPSFLLFPPFPFPGYWSAHRHRVSRRQARPQVCRSTPRAPGRRLFSHLSVHWFIRRYIYKTGENK
jgi:thiol-disulfide isomerase/thioredoxin